MAAEEEAIRISWYSSNRRKTTITAKTPGIGQHDYNVTYMQLLIEKNFFWVYFKLIRIHEFDEKKTRATMK